MRTLIAVMLVSVPAGAQAMGMHGGMGGGMGGGYGQGCTHAAVLLYALLGALGYWVLQHAGKETQNYVKRTGVAFGMTLLVIGLLGVFCGVGSHVKRSMPGCNKCPETEMTQGGHDIPMRMDMKAAKPEKPK